MVKFKFIIIIFFILFGGYSKIYGSIKKWPQGIIPYYFESNINYRERQYIREAMEDWEKDTSIKFIEISYPKIAQERIGKLYILKMYQNKEGTQPWGTSEVGYVSKPIIKYLSSVLYVNNKWTIRHELGHAIGLQHEHQRSDRDNYVWINWKNIPNNRNDCYTKINNNLLDGSLLEYDYNSIMHYSGYTPLGKVIYEKRGHKIKLRDITVIDRAKVNYIYKRNYFSVSMEEIITYYTPQLYNLLLFFNIIFYIILLLKLRKK